MKETLQNIQALVGEARRLAATLPVIPGEEHVSRIVNGLIDAEDHTLSLREFLDTKPDEFDTAIEIQLRVNG